MPADTVNVPVPVYAPVPPVADTVMIALPPLHAIELVTAELATNNVGWATLIVVVFVQPFASLTV